VKAYSMFAAFGVFFCLCMVLTAAPAWSQNVSESDENGDGKADQWIEDLGDERFKVMMDRDFNGAVDYALVYRNDGSKEYEEVDYNYDGEMDDFYFYRSGVLDRRNVDTNYDGKADLWVFLDEGVYIWKVERDMDFNGEVDYVKEYGPAPPGK
jgi:hypothetical protein